MESIPKDIKYEILPEEQTKYDISFKVIVIGDSGVGKTCLTNKATKNIFDENYNATIGFEFLTFNIKFNSKIVRLQIWDTCGQEIYRSLITNFYRNTSMAIIVYSITNRESFDNIDMWLKELRAHANPAVKIFLIGNKIDLENERKILKEEGEMYAKKNCLTEFIEASAKTGINTRDTLINIAYLLYEDYLKYKDDNSYQSDGSITSLDKSETKSNNRKKNKKSKCC